MCCDAHCCIEGTLAVSIRNTLLLAGGLLLALGACTVPGGKYNQMMAERGVAGASRDSFTVCHGHGCRLRSEVTLTAEDWAPVAAIFDGPAASAAAERQRIAEAIGVIEASVALQAGTGADRGGTLNAFSETLGDSAAVDAQIDCVDETTNTSVYLTLLDQAGYLKWHRIDGWAGRGSLVVGTEWPHQSAVIVERQGGKAFAVDSWFEDNGHAAHVVPLAEWRAGWVPSGFTDSFF